MCTTGEKGDEALCPLGGFPYQCLRGLSGGCHGPAPVEQRAVDRHGSNGGRSACGYCEEVHRGECGFARGESKGFEEELW